LAIMGEIKTNENPISVVAVVVAFYFMVSIALVFFNKITLSGTYSVGAPIFIVWIQLLTTLLCLVLLGVLGKKFPSLNFPSFEFHTEKATKLFQLGGIFLGMMVFNNLCLLNVEVSFYQVARALTVLFNVVLTQHYAGVSPSQDAARACGVVVLGFILGCIGEEHFSWMGIIFGALSSVFVGLYSIYVKKALPLVDGNHWRLMMYTTVLSMVMLFPYILIGELTVLSNSENIKSFYFWFTLIATGIFGFLINIAIFLQYKHTNSLVQNISATAKAVIQTVLAVVIFQNEISLLNSIGITLVICGYLWYSHIRSVETQVEIKQQEEKETSV